MSSIAENDSELELCARILRSLAHKVRGDLSVITNELAYIATLVDSEEIKFSRARCDKMADTLSAISELVDTGIKARTNLSEVARIFGVTRSRPEFDTFFVTASPRLLERLVKAVRDILGAGYQVEVTDSGDSLAILRVEARVTNHVGVKKSYSSISAFTADILGERFVVDAGVADLILRDHQWPARIDLEDRSVVLTISVSRGSGDV
jgi:hypothetical protein